MTPVNGDRFSLFNFFCWTEGSLSSGSGIMRRWLWRWRWVEASDPGTDRDGVWFANLQWSLHSMVVSNSRNAPKVILMIAFLSSLSLFCSLVLLYLSAFLCTSDSRSWFVRLYASLFLQCLSVSMSVHLLLSAYHTVRLSAYLFLSFSSSVSFSAPCVLLLGAHAE